MFRAILSCRKRALSRQRGETTASTRAPAPPRQSKEKDTSMCTSGTSLVQHQAKNLAETVQSASHAPQAFTRTLLATGTQQCPPQHIRRKHAPPQSLTKTLLSCSKHLSTRHMRASVTCYLVATSEATRQGPQKSSLVEAPHSMTSGQHGFAASRRRPPQHLAPSASQRLRDPRHSGWTPRPRVWHSS